MFWHEHYLSLSHIQALNKEKNSVREQRDELKQTVKVSRSCHGVLNHAPSCESIVSTSSCLHSVGPGGSARVSQEEGEAS